MDRLAAFQAVVRVADTHSFTKAAEQLSLSRARVSALVAELEGHLGARLFHRTTRHVQPTPDGEALIARCRDWLDDLDEMESLFDLERGELTGRIRVDMNHAMARDLVIPQLPGFLAEHPRLDIELSCSDGPVDLVREGLDCVVRVGEVADSALIARPLGALPVINCASPAYLERQGTPRTPADLTRQGHRVVHYAPYFGTAPARWEYCAQGQTHRLALPGALTVNSTSAYTEACLAGLGLIQVPRTGVQPHLATGRLVEVLADYRAEPMPVSLIYAHRRNLSRRVQAFMGWLGDEIQRYYAL